MKKALTISLAQTLFTIEDDAYATLEQYLQSVRRHFSAVQEQEEIIKDIEGRIAEQFLESGKNIITMVEVQAVITNMGAATEFGDTGDGGSKVEVVTSGKKKLYRNPDDKVIAGVCSGLAAYLDVDVVWVRLAFVLLTLANGLGILVYVIMWMVVPEAKSASQKLEMTGSPINLATLSENVRERVSEAAEKAGPTFKKVLAAPFVAVGIVLRVITTKFFPFLRVMFGLFLAGASFCGMVGLSFLLTLVLTGDPAKYVDFPVIEVISWSLLITLVLAGYLVFVIPAIFIFLSGIALIRKKNIISSGWGFGLLGLWCIALVVTGATGVNAGTRVYEYQVNNPVYEKNEEQINFTESLIKEVRVQDSYTLNLVQSTSTQRLVINAREKDRAEVVITEKNGVLEFSRSEPKSFCLFCDREAVELTLFVPDLEKIVVTEGSRVTAKEWKNVKTIALEINSGARVEMEVVAKELNATLKDGARLDLIGSAAGSTLNATYGARVEAQEFVVENMVANVKVGARMTLNVTKALSATAEQGGRIEYTGGAAVTEKVRDGARIEPIWPEEIEEPLAPNAPIAE